MPPLFMVLLTAAIVSVLACRRTSQEIYLFLAGACAFICFILGFALAPWQVQLLIVFGLVCWERFSGFTDSRVR